MSHKALPTAVWNLAILKTVTSGCSGNAVQQTQPDPLSCSRWSSSGPWVAGPVNGLGLKQMWGYDSGREGASAFTQQANYSADSDLLFTAAI